MADIRLKWEHSYDLEEAKKRLQPAIDKTARKFELKVKWDDNVCAFRGPATGFLVVNDGSVQLTAKLSFLARLLQSSIETKIKDELSRTLA